MGSDEECDFSGGVSLREDSVHLEFPVPSLPMSLYSPSHLDNSTVTQPPYWGMQRMSALVSVHWELFSLLLVSFQLLLTEQIRFLLVLLV